MSNIKVRFAPSPTGKLHVGNLRTALVNYLYARQQNGTFMLRIDDTDTERSRPEFEDAIRADLQWVGMEWASEDRQSARLSRYDDALAQLIASGRAYPCYETQEELSLKRKAQLMAGRPPVYDRAGLRLSEAEIAKFEEEGRWPHYRFLLEHEEVAWDDLVRGPVSYHMSSLSDPVLIREDGRVIYTLASVVDDIDHKITTILRGEDHVTNSAAQIQLFEALGASRPQMGHLALLAGSEGEGLSKRLGSLSIEQLRGEGILPAALASLLARIGTSEPVVAQAKLADVVAGFDIASFGRATAKFSTTELNQLNAKLVQNMDFETASTALSDAGYSAIDAPFWEVVKGNLVTIQEAGKWWDICHQPITPIIDDAEFMDVAASLLPNATLDNTSWSSWTKAITEQTGAKGKALFMPLRQAITGMRSGPDMGGLLPYIGYTRIIERLKGEIA
jgi:glutamyl-tRNA synthetase